MFSFHPFLSGALADLSCSLQYACGVSSPGDWLGRGVAVAGYTLASLLVLLSTKWVLRLNSVLAVAKIIALLFIVVSGWVVLAGGTKIEDPHAAFRSPFAGSIGDGNGIAMSIIRLNFSFGGYYQVRFCLRQPRRSS